METFLGIILMTAGTWAGYALLLKIFDKKKSGNSDRSDDQDDLSGLDGEDDYLNKR